MIRYENLIISLINYLALTLVMCERTKLAKLLLLSSVVFSVVYIGLDKTFTESAILILFLALFMGIMSILPKKVPYIVCIIQLLLAIFFRRIGMDPFAEKLCFCAFIMFFITSLRPEIYENKI